MTHPLTAIETDGLDTLTDLLGGAFADARPALLRAELDGREVAVVVAVTQAADDGDYRLDPLAILVDDDLLARLTAPE
jgi:hypothetical protein